MRKIIIIVIVLVSAILKSYAQDLSPILGTIDRVVPWMNNKVLLESIPSNGETDVFEISTKNNKLVIKANSVPAAGMALNYYLENYCNRHFSLNGTNLSPVKKMPAITAPVRKETPFKYRYFLNYCTHNYSSSFWGWSEWEKELDWMVLNGINLSLAVIGTEEVWYNTLLKLNYTSQEALGYLPGLGFSAWWLMGNLESWGGPMTVATMKSRTDLQKRILKRMKELGNEPVFQSFFGLVPSTLKAKYPNAHIVDQGFWEGGFVRPAFLQPKDPFFDKVADIYYSEAKALYGEFNFLGGEPFHEGGNQAGINVSEATRKVQDIMLKHNPNATWVLQAWQVNPTDDFLLNLNKDKTIILDLRGENMAIWEDRKGFNNFPWIWCIVSNFGEKNGLYGMLDRISQEPFRALKTPYGSNLKGIGFMPEGRLNNPVLFDMLYTCAWENKATNMKDWVARYSKYRYGKTSKNMEEVWQILLSTAYKSEGIMQQGPCESLFNARPDTSIQHVSSWGNADLYYENNEFCKIITPLQRAIKEFGSVDAFQYDVVDFTRQIIANEGRVAYRKMDAALRSHNLEEFEKWSAFFVELMKDQDLLLSTRKDFMLGTWIDLAHQRASSPEEKKIMEWNARTQITYWGPDNPKTSLHEYANKEWSGILKDLYIPRWEKYIAVKKEQLKGKSIDEPDYFAMEKAWSEATNPYPTQPTAALIPTVTKMLKKYNK